MIKHHLHRYEGTIEYLGDKISDEDIDISYERLTIKGENDNTHDFHNIAIPNDIYQTLKTDSICTIYMLDPLKKDKPYHHFIYAISIHKQMIERTDDIIQMMSILNDIRRKHGKSEVMVGILLAFLIVPLVRLIGGIYWLNRCFILPEKLVLLNSISQPEIIDNYNKKADQVQKIKFSRDTIKDIIKATLVAFKAIKSKLKAVNHSEQESYVAKNVSRFYLRMQIIGLLFIPFIYGPEFISSFNRPYSFSQLEMTILSFFWGGFIFAGHYGHTTLKRLELNDNSQLSLISYYTLLSIFSKKPEIALTNVCKGLVLWVLVFMPLVNGICPIRLYLIHGGIFSEIIHRHPFQ